VATAPHLDLLGQQPAQGLEGLFGAVGLPEREAAIDDDHADDRHPQLGHALARLEVLGGEGQPGGEPQHEGEEMGELEQQGQPDGFAGQGFDPIRPEGLQAAPRFARAEPRSLTAEGGEGRLGGWLAMEVPSVRMTEPWVRTPAAGRRLRARLVVQS
jgi:hypothetical protein